MKKHWLLKDFPEDLKNKVKKRSIDKGVTIIETTKEVLEAGFKTIELKEGKTNVQYRNR